MIKASATYYSILIILIIGTLCSSLVMIGSLNKKYAITVSQKNKLLLLCENGIEFGLSNSHLITEVNQEFIITDKKITITRVSWGLYDILKSQINHKKTIYKIALVGKTIADTNTAINLVNKNSKLYVCGSTKIIGNAYLPKKGVDKGHIANSRYKGSKLVYGKKILSKKQLNSITNENKQKLKHLLTLKDFNYSVEELRSSQSLSNSFTEETIIIDFQKQKSTENYEINGNIILISTDSIYISNDSKLDNVIIVADKIHIEKGFTGAIQVIANKKITIEEDVNLKYPSTLALIEQKPDKNDPHKITIGKNSIVIGSILAYSEKPDYRHEVQVKTSENSTIVGEILNYGKTEIRGEVHGKVSTNSFFLETAGSKYTNYLLDAEININKLPEDFIGGGLNQNTESKFKVISWLK